MQAKAEKRRGKNREPRGSPIQYSVDTTKWAGFVGHTNGDPGLHMERQMKTRFTVVFPEQRARAKFGHDIIFFFTGTAGIMFLFHKLK